MQHSLVNKHFVTLINYINKMNYNDNVMVMSYLYGQICHFILDSTIHPFLLYICLVDMMKKIRILINIMVCTKRWNTIRIYILFIKEKILCQKKYIKYIMKYLNLMNLMMN